MKLESGDAIRVYHTTTGFWASLLRDMEEGIIPGQVAVVRGTIRTGSTVQKRSRRGIWDAAVQIPVVGPSVFLASWRHGPLHGRFGGKSYSALV